MVNAHYLLELLFNFAYGLLIDLWLHYPLTGPLRAESALTRYIGL